MAKSVSLEEMILEALERTLAAPEPRKLHGTKASPGVFLSSNAAAKSAAQQCLDLGLIEQRGEQKSKTKSAPLYGIAPAGVAFLLDHSPVQQALRSTSLGVENLQQLTGACQRTLAQVQQHLAQLSEVVRTTAARVQPPDVKSLLAAAHKSPAPSAAAPAPGEPGGSLAELQAELLAHLQQQKRQAPLRPVELPQLFRSARSRQPALTLGQFHDALRRLAEARRIRLSPFTQAMYQLAEPECAMIIGREIMYYADSV